MNALQKHHQDKIDNSIYYAQVQPYQEFGNPFIDVRSQLEIRTYVATLLDRYDRYLTVQRPFQASDAINQRLVRGIEIQKEDRHCFNNLHPEAIKPFLDGLIDRGWLDELNIYGYEFDYETGLAHPNLEIIPEELKAFDPVIFAVKKPLPENPDNPSDLEKTKLEHFDMLDNKMRGGFGIEMVAFPPKDK